MWGVWRYDQGDKGDWLRELPTEVDDGGTAILAFRYLKDAKQRAAKHYGYASYREATKDGWCVVRKL
jgi:hypothetical protein